MDILAMLKEAASHEIAQMVRAAIRLGMPPMAENMQVWEVCQWPERKQECIYIVQPGEAVIRIRVDVIDAEDEDKLLEFFKSEPGVDVKRVEIPDNVSELFPKE